MMCPTFLFVILSNQIFTKAPKALEIKDYLLASSIATATATVIPTIGLLPAPMRPIISMYSCTHYRSNQIAHCLDLAFGGEHFAVVSDTLF